jgi:hypothetical protein
MGCEEGSGTSFFSGKIAASSFRNPWSNSGLEQQA